MAKYVIIKVKRAKKAMKKENLQFRYLYALGILFVVLSHCDGGGVELLSNWIHFGAFHLAIFVFGSGYFTRPESFAHPGSLLIGKAKRLLLPLWGWNLFYGLVLALMHRVGFTFGEPLSWKGILLFPISSEQLYSLNLGSWFVFPFFCVIVVYILLKSLLDLCKRPKLTDRILQGSFILAGVVGVYLAGHGFHEPVLYPLFRVLYFMPFYAFGMLYRDYLEKKLDLIPTAFFLGELLVLSLFLNTCFGRTVYVIPSSCDYPFGAGASYLAAVFGILFWLRVCRVLASMKKESRILVLIGQSTWEIMFHQFTGIMLVKCFFAGCRILFGVFTDFDMQAFLSDIWYLYLPKGMHEYCMLYCMGAVAVPLLVKWLKGKVKVHGR